MKHPFSGVNRSTASSTASHLGLLGADITAAEGDHDGLRPSASSIGVTLPVQVLTNLFCPFTFTLIRHLARQTALTLFLSDGVWPFITPRAPRFVDKIGKWREWQIWRARRCSDVGQERIGLRGASIGAALQAQQGARSGGGYAPSIDRCARSVLLLTRRSCTRADQLCAGTRTKHQWKTFHSH